MGAGGTLRFEENAQLRQMLNELVDGIENCTEPDGYLAAFQQAKLATDEHPDYTTSWTVHGFLEAARAGNPKALAMIRRHMNVFNNHTLIPTFLPPDGGNWPWQTPLGPNPPGFVNKSASGSGTMTGHTVYLIVQGIIHNTLMATSSVGTQADVDLVSNLYGEPWWLEALAARDLTVVGEKQFFSHNYQLTGIEAYLDQYVMTGEQKYLDGVMGAWAMHRDPQLGWIHVGGSLAINEGDIYEPGTYWLKQGQPPHEGAERAPAARKRDWFRRERGVAAGEVHEGHSHLHSHAHPHSHGHGHGGEWGGAYPTGEFCGAVFWLKINQRLHFLDPDNETFVLEMEREVYNEGLAHQGPIVNGVSSGIRYFSNLNGVKENPQTIGTCCEGQGTRLYGTYPEYLFSNSARGLYVDIYAPSAINFSFGGSDVAVEVFTDFPYGTSVLVQVASSPPAAFELALRMPEWVDAASVPVTVDGAPAGAGAPGAYLKLQQTWGSPSAPTKVAFELPMRLRAHRYTGASQVAPYTRYAYTVGPILMAATSAARFNVSLNALVVPTVDGAAPADWMVAAGDGNPMHFAVDGVDDVLFQPAFEVNDIGAIMSSYPAFEA